jgi:integrase
VTRLRKMMLEELERRNYSAGTARRYLRFVERFAQHFGKSPDKLGPDHLRSYQAYLLRERKLCPGTVENHVAALRFFFVRTLHRHQFREYLPYPKTRRKLPNILSQEEVARLINASSSLFQRALLMVLYGTGMRRSELARLKIAHIDSQRMVIHVVDGKGHKDRDLPLSPTLLENHNGFDDLLQVLRGQVQILGCHLQILMAEQELDGAQVGTGFEQMRGPCMANEMRARRLTKAGVPGRLDARQPHRLVADGLLAIAMLA